MGWFSNLSLQKRISLLVLCGFIIGLGLVSWLAVQALNESTQRVLEQRLTIARIMAGQLDETISHNLLHLQSIAGDYHELPADDKLGPMAESLRRLFSESGFALPYVMLTDRDGRVIQVEPRDEPVQGADLTTYPEVRHVLETGEPGISNIVSSQLLGAHILLVAAPILDANRQVIGLLAGAIDVADSSLNAFGQTAPVGNTGYTEIVDGNGIVIARTQPGSPPRYFEESDHPARFAQLIQEDTATVGTCHRCHDTSQQTQRQRDILAFAPLSKASWGIAIRQSEEEALAPTRELEGRLFMLGFGVLSATLFVVWMVMQDVVRPVRTLTAAAKRVASGNFKGFSPLPRRDEIGELSRAFSTMTSELASSRDELVLRNQELSALNSIASTVGQSLKLADVLENALARVLQLTHSPAGCIFLREPSGKINLMARSGPREVFQCPAKGRPAPGCACLSVLSSRQTLMVKEVSQCPMLSEVEGVTGCFTSVPLVSKDRALGIMNVACRPDQPLTESDFKLLDSIGYHVGLSIENSILYEEAKQKEILRGQLLNSVITAQEEERKRIARELHDEYGQTLTGLIMTIESLEDTVAERPQLRDRLNGAKTLVNRAIQDLRRLTLDLRPSTLDHLGLVAAVRACAQRELESRGVQVKFESKGLNERLPPATETALFRIMQEAIHNVAKHGDAGNVRIQLGREDGIIRATIQDDGQGFNVDEAFKSRVGVNSLGLLGIQERAALLGGNIDIKSKTGQGTCLTVEVPVTGGATLLEE